MLLDSGDGLVFEGAAFPLTVNSHRNDERDLRRYNAEYSFTNYVAKKASGKPAHIKGRVPHGGVMPNCGRGNVGRISENLSDHKGGARCLPWLKSLRRPWLRAFELQIAYRQRSLNKGSWLASRAGRAVVIQQPVFSRSVGALAQKNLILLDPFAERIANSLTGDIANLPG